MKNIYFTVGPTQLYPTVKKHLMQAMKEDIGSISHRGEKAKNIVRNTTQELRMLLNIPNSHSIFFLSSSLESMERIIQNCVAKESTHVTCGEFSKKFSSIAKELGKDVTLIPIDESSKPLESYSFSRNTELLCLTQNETSTGLWIDPKDIAKIKQKNPKMLVAVDVVSSVPYVQLNYEFVDLAFFSVQKGFGLPAGLSVLIVSPQALKKATLLQKGGSSIGSYHSFPALFEKEKEFQTPETPNVLFIYLLGKVCSDMHTFGIDRIRKETEEKAQYVYSFFEKHQEYNPFLKNKNKRSPTTLVIDVKGEAQKIVKHLTQLGYVVSSGYGPYKKEHIRIANFPEHSIRDMKKLVTHIKRFVP